MTGPAFDFLVIGGGSAGYNAASAAAALGLRVAVVEGGEALGGLCILRGCMPSKILIESANRHETLRRADEFGLRASGIGVEPGRILERKRRLVEEFASHRREQLQSGRFELIRGAARFVDPHTVEVRSPEGARTISARTFLIATGSELKEVEVPGLCDAGCIDSDGVLALERIPESVAVLGAGAIALEFAHYFAALGSEVTIIQRSGQILKETDADVAGALQAALERRGIRVFTNTALSHVDMEGGLERVWFEHEEKTKSVSAAEVLYALGRVPRLAGLGLENAGLAAVRRLEANCAQQTVVPHIFAAGDVTGPYEIVHIAVQQGEMAARNAARLVRGEGEPLEEMDYRLKLFAVFTSPEVAVVGATEKELAAAGVACRVATYPFADHGKAMVIGETDGLVKLIAAGQSGEILGGAVVGPHASELIHEIVMAMRFRATAADIAALPHYHPTLSEIWTYPAEELASQR